MIPGLTWSKDCTSANTHSDKRIMRFFFENFKKKLRKNRVYKLNEYIIGLRLGLGLGSAQP